MGNESYRKAYETAAAELESLLKQQEDIEERVLTLRKTLNILSELCQQEGISTDEIDKAFGRLRALIDTSVTSDIRQIIRHSSNALTAREMREELSKLGGSMAEQSNPLATISAILNRMATNGEVSEEVKNGKKAWRSTTLALSVLGGDSVQNKRETWISRAVKK